MLGITLSLPPVTSHSCTVYSIGECRVANENAYKDQADDINKCCGLDGACGEPERKCSLAGGVGKAQLLSST